MTVRTFRRLFAVTILAVALALIAIVQQPGKGPVDDAGEPVLPGLTAGLDRLKSVVVQQGTDTVSVDWTDGRWTVREKAGFPADEEKVAEVVVGLARLTKVEPKTRLPERYGRLDLQDPETPDSESKQVILIGVNGEEIANLIVGKRKLTLGGEQGGIYIRIPGEETTWLARGDINVPVQSRDWLQRTIADIDGAHIRRVTVTHPDGEKIVAVKNAPEDKTFAIENLPRGAELSSSFSAGQFGRVLAGLRIDDAAAADSVEFTPGETITAEFEGEEGLRVVLEVMEGEEAHWLRVASVSTGEAKGTAWLQAATRLAELSAGRVFKVAPSEVSALTQRMDDLISNPG